MRGNKNYLIAIQTSMPLSSTIAQQEQRSIHRLYRMAAKFVFLNSLFLPSSSQDVQVKSLKDANSSLERHSKRFLAATDASQSYFLSGVPDAFNGLTNTVTIQAVDSAGTPQTTGGDIFILRIEQDCAIDPTGSRLCIEDAGHDNMPGLPSFVEMTDNGDGTYSSDYTFTQDGTIVVSVEHVTGNGDWVEYYNNQDATGVPDIARIEYQDMNYDWGSGLVTTSAASDVSVRWHFKLVVPLTETYTIDLEHDPAYALYLDGVLMTDLWCYCASQTSQFTLDLVAGKYHDVRIDLSEGSGTCFNKMEWSSPTVSKQYLPAANQYLSERVGGPKNVYNIEVMEASVPSIGTIESHSLTHEAGTAYTMTMQSRDDQGNPLSYSTDNYSIDFSRSDGGGSEQLTSTGTHTSGGLYSTTMTPTIAGVYTMTVHMTNAYSALIPGIDTEVNGSPFDVTVYPGEVDPLLCYTDVPASPTVDASNTFNIQITFVDRWGNVHYETMNDEISNGMYVEVVADYVDHNDYPSPIGVADDPNWQATYGIQHYGSFTDNNDGTLSTSLTISRAGSYTLTIQVDGTDVIGSPHNHLEITPTVIHAPTCVAVNVPTVMVAGYDYSFQIQSRDQYANNLADVLSTAVGTDHSALYTANNDGSETIPVTIQDDTDPGVFKVDISLDKLQFADTYDLDLMLGGLEVPTSPITIQSCTNTIAASDGIISTDDNTNTLTTQNLFLTGTTETISLPSVEIFCDQTPTQIFTQAIATLPDTSTMSLTEAQLASYGITIQPSGASPTLKINYSDNAHAGITFDIEISATVVEETTWADINEIQIVYIPTAIPDQSTVETHQLTHVAGTTYSMTMQSRDGAGNLIDASSFYTDNYSIDFSRSDGLGSEQLTTTGSHTSGGLYSSSLTPTIAGVYTMTVDMTNDYTTAFPAAQTEISGSPFSVTVYPGQVDPLQCYSDVPASPTAVASNSFSLQIQFVDDWGNEHYQTMTDDITAGMTVSVVADYVDHNDYPSPIGVADDPTWQATYGIQHTGTMVDNNDGTMSTDLTIYRAGSYTLTIQVDGTDVIGSPHNHLEITPTVIHAPTCVAVNVPTVMVAGYDYSFQIQSRDQYANNLADVLSTAVGTDHSALYTANNDGSETITATVSDDTDPGVFKVDVSLDKLQLADIYDLDVLLSGLEVPTSSITIDPCTNTIAAADGTISQAGNTNTLTTQEYQLVGNTETVPLPLVEIYCDQTPIQLLLSAIATLPDGSTVSLTEIQLATYGVTIQPSGASPTLTIQSTNTDHAGTSLDVQISATVSEETTWADTNEIIINFIPTVPAQSTVETHQLTHVAGTAYSMTMQSRDASGTPLNYSTDNYSIDFSRSDGLGSEQLTTTGSHTSGGLYSSSLTPTIAGVYTMTVDMTNAYSVQVTGIQTEISGSPFSVTVYPGEVDPLQCYSDVPASPTAVASNPFSLQIQFVDNWGNEHYQTMTDDITAGMTVSVVANYVDHNDYLSPIGVPDDPTWQATYGTSHPGTLLDNNDGTMSTDLTIYRAGSYTLNILVDGTHIISSPHNHLEITPTSIDVPTCAAKDVPTTIYAGYDYFFLIQSRDQYANNLSVDLATAVGTNFSGALSLIEDPSESIPVTITDDVIASGIYRVDISLSKLQPSGDYDLDILLGGLEVPTPTITIEECMNFIAAERGLVDPAGNMNQLDSVDFTIDTDAQITISLPRVTSYCAQTPLQVLLQASAVLENGDNVELTEDELLAYGIELNDVGFSPTLTVFSDNTKHGQITFDLQISATSFEEETWFDTTLVTIKYIYVAPNTYVHTIRDVEDPVEFDEVVTSDHTLQMTVDATGKKVFAPLTLECGENWSKKLPGIVDEEDGKKFDIKVSLGATEVFLAYEPVDRVFSSVLPLDVPADKDFSVVIDLVNSTGKLTRYIIDVTYTCEVEEPQEVPPNSYELVYDVDPPVPYIHSVTYDGVAKIRFNREMAVEASLTDDELYQDSAVRRLVDPSSDTETVGEATELFSNFTKIHNSTVRLNGTLHESLKVSIEVDEGADESQCHEKLDFKWETIMFEPEELTLQLYFIWPECISSASNQGDFLVITFFDQRLFRDKYNKLIRPFTTLRQRIRRQIDPKDGESGGLSVLFGILSSLIVVVSLMTIFGGLLLRNSSSFIRMVNALKGLQLIVHSLLIQVFLGAHVETFLNDLKRMLTLAFFESEHFTQQAFSLHKTEALDLHFESMGYESSTLLINLSSLISVLVIMICLGILLHICGKLSPYYLKSTYVGDIHECTGSNGAIVFYDFSFLIIAVSCCISMYKSQETDGDTNLPVAITLIALTVPYLLCLYTYLYHNKDKLQSKEVKTNVGAAYTNLSVKKPNSKLTFFYSIFTYVRRFSLALVVTYGKSSLLAQLLYLNYCSILCICLISQIRPFQSTWDNRLEFWTEFTILLLFSLCLTQTDYVIDPHARFVMSWVIVGLICLSLFMTYGYLLTMEVMAIVRKVKILTLKSKWEKRLEYIRFERSLNKSSMIKGKALVSNIPLDKIEEEPLSVRKDGKAQDDDNINSLPSPHMLQPRKERSQSIVVEDISAPKLKESSIESKSTNIPLVAKKSQIVDLAQFKLRLKTNLQKVDVKRNNIYLNEKPMVADLDTFQPTSPKQTCKINLDDTRKHSIEKLNENGQGNYGLHKIGWDSREMDTEESVNKYISELPRPERIDVNALPSLDLHLQPLKHFAKNHKPLKSPIRSMLKSKIETQVIKPSQDQMGPVETYLDTKRKGQPSRQNSKEVLNFNESLSDMSHPWSEQWRPQNLNRQISLKTSFEKPVSQMNVCQPLSAYIEEEKFPQADSKPKQDDRRWARGFTDDFINNNQLGHFFKQKDKKKQDGFAVNTTLMMPSNEYKSRQNDDNKYDD